MRSFQCNLALALVVMLVLTACQRQEPAPDPARSAQPSAEPPRGPASAPPVRLQDVSESDPRYLVGISYPQTVNKYPGLAVELKKYSDAARSELMQAVNGMGSEAQSGPYDLSLNFTQLVDSPDLVAIAADGSSYTGGAHGNALIARFVWLPRQDRLLTAAELVPDTADWAEISSYAREQLHTALSQRIDSDATDPAERAELLRTAGRMIDEGTAPEAANFAQFEPILAPNGRIRALRFVFPPYQVGPYSDGTQSVLVPASVLLPNVAPGYQSLFIAGS